MTDKLTRLYTDVDGVINADMPHLSWPADTVAVGTASAGGQYQYRIRWSTDMLAALSELPVERVWATTWVGAAPTGLADLIGYGKGDRFLVPLNGREVSFPSIIWKGAAIRAEQAEDPSPFIWVDDEIGPYQHMIAHELGGLALSIDAARGITPENIEDMILYIEQGITPYSNRTIEAGLASWEGEW